MEPTPKIEVLAPFSAAFELTKRILFQPFDIAKWFAIGLAAFLAGLADGTRFTPSFRMPEFSGRAQTQNVELDALFGRFDAFLVWPVIGALVLLGLAMLVLFMWLGSRGRFMFIDCIVQNRGAVEQPWREHRREGNSLFLWSLLISGVALLIAAVLAAPPAFRYLQSDGFDDFGIGMVIYTIALVVSFTLAGLALTVLTWFMAPVMYRQRCNAVTAFRTVIGLILREPAPFILYVLVGALVVIAGGILSCVITCVTCRIAAIPYIGTVVLLPLYVFYYAYLLLFMRQFGPEYDVWANVVALPVEAPTGPPPPPAAAEEATRPPSEPPPLPG